VRDCDWGAYARWQDAQSALAEDTKFKELLERTLKIHQVTERIITVEVDV